MTWWKSIATRKLTTDQQDVLIGQCLFYATVPLFFSFGVIAVSRNATTTGELTIGILATVCASLLFLLVGLCLPMASSEWRAAWKARQRN